MLKENHNALRNLLGTLKHLRALKALGCPTGQWDHLILHIVVNKLDSNIVKEWETSLENSNSPSLEKLKKFLNQWCQALEIINKTRPKSSNPQPLNQKSSSNKYSSHVASVNIPCPACRGDHLAYYC